MKTTRSIDNRTGKTRCNHRAILSRGKCKANVEVVVFEEVVPNAHRSAGLPDPPILPKTRVIEVRKVFRAIGLKPSAPRVYPYKIRKLLAFLWIEGIQRTSLKLRDALLAKTHESEEALVVVVGQIEDSHQWCAACGRQYSVHIPRMLFREELIFPATNEKSAVDLSKKIIEDLKGDTAVLRDLVNLSPYSREKMPVLSIMPERGRLADPQISAAERVRRKVLSVDPRTKRDKHSHLIQIGAGDYPYVYVLPHMKGHVFDTVVEYNPLRAKAVADRFGFRYLETDYRRVLDRAAALPSLTVFVASYHSLHTDIAIDFLKANPRARVFIEKPPIVGYDQLQELLPYIRSKDYFVEIGYNRRYASMVKRAAMLLNGRTGPVIVTCIPREDDMQPSSWSFWSTEGGRVHENLCHWIDLGVMLAGTRPVELVSLAGKDYQSASSVAVRFEDDSILNLISGVVGNGVRGVQEYIDIKADYLTIQIDDFRRMIVLNGGSRQVYRQRLREKGHIEMYRRLAEASLKSLPPLYPLKDFVRSCVLMEEIWQMLSQGHRHRIIDVNRIKELEGE